VSDSLDDLCQDIPMRCAVSSCCALPCGVRVYRYVCACLCACMVSVCVHVRERAPVTCVRLLLRLLSGCVPRFPEAYARAMQPVCDQVRLPPHTGPLHTFCGRRVGTGVGVAFDPRACDYGCGCASMMFVFAKDQW
jgi:hypothetical protein